MHHQIEIDHYHTFQWSQYRGVVVTAKSKVQKEGEEKLRLIGDLDLLELWKQMNARVFQH